MLNAVLKKKLRDFELDVHLTVNPGETLGLLGPNGSGKSTVLKLISGLMKPDAGIVEIDTEVLYDSAKRIFRPAEVRNIGYMFQNYALFPHMTARENIEYGLKMRRVSAEERRTRSHEMLESLGLLEIADEPVTKISGGQRQRTALARALAPKPSLLLLDEPLSALDSKTQDKLRQELASVIRQEGISCILVTHSILDTLAVADRAALLNRGRISASGTPEEIVHNPAYGFVMSENPNIFRGEVWIKDNGVICVRVGVVDFRVVTRLSGTVTVSVRPEELILSRNRFASTAVNVFEGRIVKIEQDSNADEMLVHVDIGIPLTAAVTRQSVERLQFAVGDRVTVTCKATAIRVFV